MRSSFVPCAFLLAIVSIAGVFGEDPLVCFDGPFDNTLLDGCVDDCKSFETLAEAEEHCNSLADCGGITKSAYGDEEAINLGVGLYEVRMGPALEVAKGDTTWIKQIECQEGTQTATQQAVNDLDHLVAEHELTPEASTGTAELCYTFSAPVQGQYLEGCVDECRSFQTLEEAQDYCDSIPDCGGVTHSLSGEGQAWHDGVGPYEVRMGPALKASNDGDISWVRIEHPCSEEGLETGYEADYGDWNDSLDNSVKQVDRSLVQSIVYLLVFLALAGAAVFISYRLGHQVTIDYVDRAKDKLREFVDKRGPRESSGPYETL